MNIEQLEKASAAYYTGYPTMTDAEFDKEIEKLRLAEPDHPFLKRIGAPTPGTVKVKHAISMGSLSNTNNGEELGAWMSRCESLVPKCMHSLCASHKLDGSSLELIYEDGCFVQAITRGDGEEGEDVTRNALLSGNIPLSIHSEITSVRCECLIHKDDWEKYFIGDANPRNSAAGTLRRHDGDNAQYLQFYAFDILACGPKTAFIMESDFDAMCLLSQWFKVPEFISMSANEKQYPLEYIMEWCNSAEDKRDSFPYEIDGVVLKVDNRALCSELGVTNSRPRGQVAFKFTPRGGETVLNDVVWQVGHTGAITPVGEVSPVGVGGTTISRVTLCNMDEIARLNICIGDTVEIVRAGDVIPKLSRLVRANKTSRPIKFPKRCPGCGSKTSKDGAVLYCSNDFSCSGVAFSRVMTWVKKRNILNVGESLVKATEIDTIEELYTACDSWSLAAWANLEFGKGRLGEKRATKAIEAIEKSRHVSLPEFLGSVGIKGVGRSLCRTLCDGLGLLAIDDVFAIKPEEIESLEGFGSSRAYDFCTWVLEHEEELENLSSCMIFEDQPDTEGDDGPFAGEVICFTGKSPMKRPEMSQRAESAGASVSSSISLTTTILVIADPESQSAKAVKARKMGIKLMSPDDFLSRVGV